MSDVTYVGTDLEDMTFARNYHRWILDEIRPYLGRSVVEVGAGTGGFSQLLLNEHPKFLTLVEPSEMFIQLVANVNSKTTAVEFHQSIFADIYMDIARRLSPDSILYINVLEHIERDLDELKLVHDCLAPGGRVLIFVPALRQLYGNFDRNIGHYRRYSRRDLVQKVAGAGFEILTAKYFDFTGILPWFIKYRILRSGSLSPVAVKAYDKLAVPFTRFLESLLIPPIGKNILLAAKKS